MKAELTLNEESSTANEVFLDFAAIKFDEDEVR
jgi:hypothetical protein